MLLGFLFVLNNQIQLSSGERRLEVDSVKISDGSCKVFCLFSGHKGDSWERDHLILGHTGRVTLVILNSATVVVCYHVGYLVGCFFFFF